MKKVTLVDVAQKAGVSPALVSLVLNRRPQVNAATEIAVRKVIAEMGYVSPRPENKPGPKAAAQVQKICHLVLVSEMGSAWAPVYLDLLRGMQTQTSATGSNLIMADAREKNAEGNKFFSHVDGIIILGDHEIGTRTEWEGIPKVITMGGEFFPCSWDHVSYDNRIIGSLAADYLSGKGHHRVAVLGNVRNDIEAERVNGFRRGIESAGGECEIFSDAEDFAQLRQRIGEERSPLPTAFFSVMDGVTSALYHVLYHDGKLIPGKNVEIVSTNNETAHLKSLRPYPAVIDIHAELIGQRSVEQLLWRIRHPGAPPVKTLITPRLLTPKQVAIECSTAR